MHDPASFGSAREQDLRHPLSGNWEGMFCLKSAEQIKPALIFPADFKHCPRRLGTWNSKLANSKFDSNLEIKLGVFHGQIHDRSDLVILHVLAARLPDW
ncbi:MAG: hypothetical protein EHM17_09600 [Verrucomicrobiaceae bacterium]|nr:MAG: hypothetical protein EHM17_09600 [Verrucomicrobiaceae bacterium]